MKFENYTDISARIVILMIMSSFCIHRSNLDQQKGQTIRVLLLSLRIYIRTAI